MRRWVLLVSSLLALPAYAGDNRSYVSGNFMFNLDGVKCGFIKSVDGGAITAEVIAEPTGPDYYVKKHIGQPKYEDFTLQIGFSMNRAVSDWVESSWSAKPTPSSGSVVAVDVSGNAQSEREFFNALITEVTIPACDGSSKDPAYMTLKFSPEYTRYKKASGKASSSIDGKNQKTWLPSNFRLNIDGLDCSKVNKVDSFTVKQTAITDDLGTARDYLAEPGKLEFPNLAVSVSESTVDSWLEWQKDFPASQERGQPDEREGTLDLLDADRSSVLARIGMHGCGIAGLSPSQSSATGLQAIAQLYCRTLNIYFPGSAGVKTAP